MYYELITRTSCNVHVDKRTIWGTTKNLTRKRCGPPEDIVCIHVLGKGQKGKVSAASGQVV